MRVKQMAAVQDSVAPRAVPASRGEHGPPCVLRKGFASREVKGRAIEIARDNAGRSRCRGALPCHTKQLIGAVFWHLLGTEGTHKW